MAIREGELEDMAVNREFWKNREVFLTGHTGFKGGWLSLWLQDMRASVTGYSLAPESRPSLFEEAKVGNGMKSVIDDIRHYENLSREMSASGSEIAFHFAAQPLVRESYRNPAGTYSTNVMGTVNFLEAVRSTPSVRAAIVVTSDKCYENRELQRGYREDDPMGGSDPYSSSKGCAELVTAAYRRSFFSDGRVALATVRAGNVIGGGDWAQDRLVPDLVRTFSARRPLALRYPKAVRPWQHVLEPLNGYLMLAEKLYEKGEEFAGGWNFGPWKEDSLSVAELVRTASTIWGEDSRWTIDGAFTPHEANILRLDCELARMRLGWKPLLDFEETVRWTISWYKAFLEGGNDMRRYSNMQIQAYEELRTAFQGPIRIAAGAFI